MTADAPTSSPAEPAVPADPAAEETLSGRRLLPGQRCRIRIWDRATGGIRTVHETTERLYEAPNWSADGRLLVNADGLLFWLPADGSGAPALLGVPACRRSTTTTCSPPTAPRSLPPRTTSTSGKCR